MCKWWPWWSCCGSSGEVMVVVGFGVVAMVRWWSCEIMVVVVEVW